MCNFYAPQMENHLFAFLSVSLFVRPLPCPANKFKTTVGI